MKIAAKVIAASLNRHGDRLITIEAKFPRFILAEVNTHRVFSRNSASSRAIPVKKVLAGLEEDYFMPKKFLENKRGMQGGGPLDPEKQKQAEAIWLEAKAAAMKATAALDALNVHKQHANRLVEPFLPHTVIITSAHWQHFFNLRVSPEAQPEFNELAEKIQISIGRCTPTLLQEGEWHLPYVDGEDRKWAAEVTKDNRDFTNMLKRISVAHCARVSYMNHDGEKNYEKDLEIVESLKKNGHWSPFEHQATPGLNTAACGNFINTHWIQLRKIMPDEWRVG